MFSHVVVKRTKHFTEQALNINQLVQQVVKRSNFTEQNTTQLNQVVKRSELFSLNKSCVLFSKRLVHLIVA